VYTDKERAVVWFTLQANEGNVNRTARDTGIPENTVRTWRDNWRDHPPEFDEADLEEMAEDATTFIEKAEHVRDLLLGSLEQAVKRGELKADKLALAIGILDDKIRLNKGLATSRHETVVALPPPEQIRDMFAEFALQAGQAAQARHDVIEGEIVREEEQPKGLLPSTTKEK
jgi:transposase-like protein